MNRANHTPGPWKCEIHHTKREIWNQNTHVASIQELGHTLELNEANARLIAAAPELLEAALYVLKEVTNLPGTGVQDGNLGWRHVHALRAAVAKATGGAL